MTFKVTRAIGVCLKVVGSFPIVGKKRCDLAEVQHALKLPVHMLKSDCVTRWGSAYLMISRVPKQKDAIRQVLHWDPKSYDLCPT